ncbi:D-alanine--poly(phosphoribitol) ligase subunit 1 [Rhizobium mongolense subsp. loessense]|uniref:D-alanine--poly(Phosphoribitol) ligase subunit 1 n=2 Tax=Rhizobium mongolense TaxID=57676 RepID=A0A1G4UAX0_9HYPH|nr:D-alanine--poly(phosphoribitol) ligase subunit 1 [Rhizobium mongolense subsp. loessense]
MVDNILHRIRGHILQSPERPALVSDSGVTCFGELGRRCEGIRSCLREIEPGPLVVIGHKEHDCVAAMLACAFSGRPFVFVDRSNPVQRIEVIAHIAGASHAFVAGGDIDLPLLHQIDLRAIEAAPLPADPTIPAIGGDTLFYIVFTSGSTGQPKGVAISRENFKHFDSWYGPMRQRLAGDGAHVNHASLAFDMGMLDLWPALANGSAVIMMDHRNNVLARNNVRLLAENGATTPASWFSTPSLLQIMCTDKDFNGEAFPELRCFFVGGEVVQKSLIRDLWRRFPNASLCHAYGPTEVTCVTHAKVLDEADVMTGDLLPLGPALAPSSMRILREDGSEASGGEPGEVQLLGPQVGQGYLPSDHPRNHAFGDWAGMRTYMTGDLGYIDIDGSLILLGRVDRQVKWNGNRIELNEIERVANDLPYVRQATCVPLLTDGRVTNIVLFAQMHTDRHVTRDRLIAEMRLALPAVMVPRDIRIVDKFILNVNGKVDAGRMLELRPSEISEPG